MDFLCSDLHINHHNIIRYCRRPFADVEEMNRVLIENWNNTVNETGDTVYLAGDAIMGDRTLVPQFLRQLHGHIVLIRGNHDHKRSLEHFPEWYERIVLPMGGGRFMEVVHSPYDALQTHAMVACGHVHDAWRVRLPGEPVEADLVADHTRKGEAFVPRVPFVNVGTDVNNFRPITVASVVREYDEWKRAQVGAKDFPK